jgi:hypothetical protein
MRGLRLTSRRCAQTGQGNVISLDSPRLTALLFDLITLISSWLPSRLVSILFPHSGISHAHCPSPRLAPRNLSYLQILFAGGRRRGQRSVHHPNMMLPRWIYIWAGHLAELNELFTNKMCQPHLAQAPSRAHHRDAEDAWTCDWQAVSISHMFRGLYHRKELAFVPKHTS